MGISEFDRANMLKANKYFKEQPALYTAACDALVQLGKMPTSAPERERTIVKMVEKLKEGD